MCCLFGLADYGNSLSVRGRTQLLSALAAASEERGVDATGIAYNSGGRLRVYKRPLPAHRMRFRVPGDAHVIMGHTRMATQGEAARNRNNHPFRGRAGNTRFALAHNGVLWNDETLRWQYRLPATEIETGQLCCGPASGTGPGIVFFQSGPHGGAVAGDFYFYGAGRG